MNKKSYSFSEHKETWAEIKDFPDYEISTLGRVRAIERIVKGGHSNLKVLKSKILKLKKQRDRGYRVGLRSYGVQYFRTVHVLQAKAFVPNPENKGYVIHLDNIKENNFPWNLAWATEEECREIGHLSQKLSGKCYKLNNHRSVPCCEIKEDGTEINYKSLSEASRKTNGHIGNIRFAALGIYNKAAGRKYKIKRPK
jgi:hypothetical protein